MNCALDLFAGRTSDAYDVRLSQFACASLGLIESEEFPVPIIFIAIARKSSECVIRWNAYSK